MWRLVLALSMFTKAHEDYVEMIADQGCVSVDIPEEWNIIQTLEILRTVEGNPPTAEEVYENLTDTEIWRQSVLEDLHRNPTTQYVVGFYLVHEDKYIPMPDMEDYAGTNLHYLPIED